MWVPEVMRRQARWRDKLKMLAGLPAHLPRYLPICLVNHPPLKAMRRERKPDYVLSTRSDSVF